MLTLTNKQQTQQGKGTAKSTKDGTKRQVKKTAEKASSLACMIDCGTDHQHSGQASPQSNDHVATTPLLPTAQEKDLKRVLEAGLMINGLKVLFMTAAEKIDLHVSHNAITPGLLLELEDIAKAITLTTKKLNSIRTPCCDLYVQVLEEDDDD